MHKQKTPFFRTDLGRGIGTALFDIVMICIGLGVFSLFHFVLPSNFTDEVIVIPTPKPTAQEVFAPEQNTEKQDAQEEKFPGVFTDGEIVKTDSSYKSPNISIEITAGQQSKADYRCADIYVRDVSLLKTAFAQGKAATGYHESVPDMAKDNSAILAVNGDYFGLRKKGLVIRDGVVYRQTMSDDACVLYMDGSMEVYTKATFDLDAVVAKQPYQGWAFGPSLLDENGARIDGFTHEVAPKNPRTAIGYYEPGHYCLVTVDGRSSQSKGMTLTELSALMEQLGCKIAYNLDGGQSSMMVFDGNTVGNPYKGGRESSDIIYIAEAEG